MSEKKANKGLSSFFEGVKAEFNKIIWPTREDIIKQTTAVVIISVIVGAIIAVCDYGFGYFVNFITSIG